MIVAYPDFYSAWVELLRLLVTCGAQVGPRGKATKELLGLQLFVEDARANILVDATRALNYRFLVAQWLTTLLGMEDTPTLLRFNRNLAGYEDDGQGGRYPSYGPRLKPQWPYLLRCFQRDPETRQAVMGIWEAQGASADTRDVPCTLSLQFLLRGTWLHTVATMRSSDAWLGLPYDVFNFTMLGNYLAGALTHVLRRSVELGTFTLNLGSSHLYEEHWARAVSVVHQAAGSTLRSPRLPAMLDDPPLADFLTRVRTDAEAYGLPKPWYTYGLALTANSQASALYHLRGLSDA